ncbi:MAG: integrin alpha, partial [Patescibacteria group bacterium]
AAGDISGYSVSSAGDVNNDGYDDIITGAYGNDDGGSMAGAAFLVYGQTTQLTSASLSTAVEFTGEAAGDYAGYSVATSGDVNNDGYDDLIIGATNNNDGGSSAGATYLIYGQSANLTSASLSTPIEFMGETANNEFGNYVSCGDMNGDGFSDILVGDKDDDSVANNAGAIYAGYLYIDNDGDGLAGTDGLFDGADTNDNDHDNDGSETGTDCNDDDATVYTNQTYYQDSDGDGLGNALVTTSVCASVAPTGYAANTNDTNDTIKDISAITAGDNGDITITYVNNSIATIDVFSYTGTGEMTLKQYEDNYYLVLHPKAKKLALVDINALAVLSSKTLAEKKFKYNSLKTYTLRDKKWAVVTAKNKKGKVKLSLMRIKINDETLGKKVQVSLENNKIKPAHTKKNDNKILLRNKNAKIIRKYLLTKKYNLKEL